MLSAMQMTWQSAWLRCLPCGGYFCGSFKLTTYLETMNTAQYIRKYVYLVNSASLLTHSDLKLAGPLFTHNLHRHRNFRNVWWEILLQKSVRGWNSSAEGCAEQNLAYSLQLASCLGLSKLRANKYDTHSSFDVNNSFVIYVTRLLTVTMP
jgi:hypothetical protein